MNESSTARKHRMLVADLAKKPQDINLTHAQKDLMHAALGIAGEAGEVVDLIKKHIIYTGPSASGPPLNVVHLTEELGDLEFYLAMLRSACGIDREVVLQMNINKLRKRFPSGYDNQAAQDRADKEQGWIDDEEVLSS